MYIALLSDPALAHVTCDPEWVTVAFIARLFLFLNVHPTAVLTALFGSRMAGATWNCCRSAHVPCAPYKNAPVYAEYYVIRSHKCRVHVSLAITCHLHFWQNDPDLLRATVR